MSPRILLRQLRVYQWVKNVLLFSPLLLAHATTDSERWVSVTLAFLAFCLSASGVYVLNDLLDIDADRQHITKRFRPLASGAFSIQAARVAIPMLFIGGGVLGYFVGETFLLWLLAYVIATTAYSMWLKRVVLLDVLILAGLYAVRVQAGAVAADVPLTPWLIAFALFLFMSLAFLKRYVEIRDAVESETSSIAGRGYVAGDATFVANAGPAMGYIAVLVFILYMNGPSVQGLYLHPLRLWLMVPVLVYWISRMWLIAQRGEMHDDPIVYTARDPHSYAVGLVTAAIVASASW